MSAGTGVEPRGLRSFSVVWLGQVVSMLGTGMTQFAITIWAWQATGSATALALVGFFTFAPTVLLSPFAGAIVDRSNRKHVMVAGDMAAASATAAILALYSAGRLEIWHLFVAGAFNGAFSAFQFPAYSAAITMMVRKEDFARASGMLSLAESISAIGAPVLAGAGLPLIGLSGVLCLDIATFGVAVLALAVTPIPQPATSVEGAASRGSLWAESLFGFRYILGKPSLLGLQLVFFATNLVATMGLVLLSPMVLAHTRNSESALATVQSAMGAGGLVGGLLLTVWGGPVPRINGVLGGMTVSGVLGLSVMGLGWSVPLWALGGFVTMLCLPIVNGSNQAIWQSKVAPDIQGKVFAARRLIAQLSAPVAMLAGGVLADRVFEPAMAAGGRLTGFAPWSVAGPGAGMSLMLLMAGLGSAAIGVVGYAIPAIRDVESILPDAAPSLSPPVTDSAVVASSAAPPGEAAAAARRSTPPTADGPRSRGRHARLPAACAAALLGASVAAAIAESLRGGHDAR